MGISSLGPELQSSENKRLVVMILDKSVKKLQGHSSRVVLRVFEPFA